MKNVICLITLAFLGLGFASKSQAQSFLTNGIEAYYPFNGNVNDAIGLGNNGTNNGAWYTTDRFGVPGAAIYFTNDAVTTGFFPPLGNAARTISGWFNVKANANLMALFNYGGNGGTAGGRIEADIDPSGVLVLDLSGGRVFTTNVCNDSHWHHLAVVIPNDSTTTNIIIYVDGKFQGAMIGSPGFINTQNTYPLSFGELYDGSRRLTGSLDTMRFYDRALSASEVQQLYQFELVAPEGSFTATATATAIWTGSFVVAVTNLFGGYGYTNTPLVHIIGGGGSGAQAVAVVSNGVVIAVKVTDAGNGYTNMPVIVIDPPFIPNPVLGIAAMSFLSFSNLTLGGGYQLQQAVQWYWTNVPVIFTATNATFSQMVPGVADSGGYRLTISPAPVQAFATPEVINGFVVGATITSGGSGYVTAPAIQIIGGGGTNALGYSRISSSGVITNITMTDAGYGYTNLPTIKIDPPPAAAISPSVSPMMRLDSSSLAPYENYQVQFVPVLGMAWQNWSGGTFSPTDTTNSQFVFITNKIGFFRLQYLP